MSGIRPRQLHAKSCDKWAQKLVALGFAAFTTLLVDAG
jgi:hypothetical protein